MRIFQDYRELPDDARGACVALGNFDGVHAGHRAVIARAGAAAERAGAPLAVMMFDPPPRRFFQPDIEPFRIMSIERRARLLEKEGVDLMFVLPFDASIAVMTDAEFAQKVLHDGLGAKAVAVGFDFRFGKGRMGDASSLGVHGLRLGFETLVAAPVVAGPDKISSTMIRDRLRNGDVAAAGRLLGGYWTVEAIVEHGEKRGRTIGFPTANMRLGDNLHPRHGVYAVWTRIEGEEDWRAGVASFGRTPTTGLRDPLLEVFVHDYSGDLYGKQLEVAFAGFLREERKYDTLEALVAQIGQDSEDARRFLNDAAPAPAMD